MEVIEARFADCLDELEPAALGAMLCVSEWSVESLFDLSLHLRRNDFPPDDCLDFPSEPFILCFYNLAANSFSPSVFQAKTSTDTVLGFWIANLLIPMRTGLALVV